MPIKCAAIARRCRVNAAQGAAAIIGRDYKWRADNHFYGARPRYKRLLRWPLHEHERQNIILTVAIRFGLRD